MINRLFALTWTDTTPDATAINRGHNTGFYTRLGVVWNKQHSKARLALQPRLSAPSIAIWNPENGR